MAGVWLTILAGRVLDVRSDVLAASALPPDLAQIGLCLQVPGRKQKDSVSFQFSYRKLRAKTVDLRVV
jgi:hypothetical protein